MRKYEAQLLIGLTLIMSLVMLVGAAFLVIERRG